MKPITLDNIPQAAKSKGGDWTKLDQGYSFRVNLDYDDAEPPWEWGDGHGRISEWTRRDKRPGELVLCSDRGSKRYYDFTGAVKLARRDGWNTKPYDKVETKGERAARAALADYNYLRQWCNGEWWYMWILVTLKRNGEEVASDSLGMVESYGDYWRECALELLQGAVDRAIQARKTAVKLARKETIARKYWACADVVTI